MNNDVFKMLFLLEEILRANSPVLSGNMQSHIKVVEVKENGATICIEAPFYDTSEWEKTGKIIYTGKSYNGITDYANWVNNLGAFGRKSSPSRYWANRVCNEVAEIIASEIGAEVRNSLPLT